MDLDWKNRKVTVPHPTKGYAGKALTIAMPDDFGVRHEFVLVSSTGQGLAAAFEKIGAAGSIDLEMLQDVTIVPQRACQPA